jgi:predicted protein tyrosine phosphatase
VTTKVLFVCSRNRLRSPTAEAVFGELNGIETASAGLNPDSPSSVDDNLIAWADMIMVMEDSHLARLKKRFARHIQGKEVVVLGIPDRFEYMDPDLVALLKRRALPRIQRAIRRGRV